MVKNNSINASNVFKQFVFSSTATYTDCTGEILQDNSFPQNTEGTELLTTTITPTNASSILIVEATIPYAIGAGAGGQASSVAIFRDATANAIQSGLHADGFASGSEGSDCYRIYYEVTAGSTASTTFKLRVGGFPAAGTKVNGTTARRYGGVQTAYLTVKEYF